MKIPTVFISYSHEDRDMVEDVLLPLKALEALGKLKLFIDRSIPSGTRWNREIEHALSICDAAIVIVTSSYISSEYCRDLEWPRIVDRTPPKDVLRLYLVFGALPPREALPQEMSARQFAIGEERALSILSPKQRRTECKELADRIAREVRTTSPPSLGLIESASIDRAVDKPNCVQFAKELGKSYSSCIDAGLRVTYLKELVILCLRRTNDEIVDISAAFLEEAPVLEQSHIPIVELLKVGLPVRPTHLEEIADIRVDKLFDARGYADLLRGLRLSEGQWGQALDLLEKIPKSAGVLERCPLRFYALGQAYRKLNRSPHDLESTLSNLEDAKSHLDSVDENSEVCDLCEVRCRRNRLMAQIERGLGVISRLLGKEEDAREHYEIAGQIAEAVGSKALIADISYSAGYCSFESAGRRKIADESVTELLRDPRRVKVLLRDLKRAQEKFETAERSRAGWTAPRARLNITRQMIARIGPRSDMYETGKPRPSRHWLTLPESEIRRKYRQLWNTSHPGRGLEPDLTRVLCGVGAVVFSADIPSGGDVWQALLEIAKRYFLAKGPIACHLLDISCIVDWSFTDSPVDPNVLRVLELLRHLSLWEFETKEQQDALVREYLRKGQLGAGA